MIIEAAKLHYYLSYRFDDRRSKQIDACFCFLDSNYYVVDKPMIKQGAKKLKSFIN